MQLGNSLIALAGFAFAHAAWSVSDLPQGELLVPLAVIEKAGQKQLLRFEAESQEQAIAEGKAVLSQHEQDLDAWAFVREGRVSEGGRYIDVLTVEAKCKGSGNSIVFVQRFQPFASGRFRLLGRPDAVVAGKVLSEVEAAPLIEQLDAGVHTHPKAAEHWSEWSE